MLFIPVGAALFDPVTIVVAFFLIDTFVALPLLLGALKLWNWRSVFPVLLGSWCGVSLGAYLLANMAEAPLRWSISAIIVLLAALLLSGWRYRDEPKLPVSLTVGAVSGVLGGVSQVSAPPVVAYWLSGPFEPSVIRANLICFFCFASLGSGLAFFANGVFTPDAGALSLWLAPFYGAAIFAGARLFSGAGDKLLRRVALALIVFAALMSVPALDPLLGR